MPPRSGWHRPRRRFGAVSLVTGVIIALLGACGSDPSSDPSNDRGAGHGRHGATMGMGHIHGLGVNPADGELYVATHYGLFRLPEQGDPERVAGSTQDVMGFAVVGPDHFVASGHPGADQHTQPANLGLIESTDAGQSWAPVSRHGEADFHALEARHGQVYGYDVVSGRLMVSADQQNWEQRAELPMADLAVSPEDPDVVLATTEQGPARSTDGGRTFLTVEAAPVLVFLDWSATGRLVGLSPDGIVHTSTDHGGSWSEAGQVPGQPTAILASDRAEVYVATNAGIHRSLDHGETFTLLHQLD